MTETTVTTTEQSDNKEKGKDKDEDTKIFTIRGIPPELHKTWKMVCLQEAITMELYAIAAIKEKIARKYGDNVVK